MKSQNLRIVRDDPISETDSEQKQNGREVYRERVIGSVIALAAIAASSIFIYNAHVLERNRCIKLLEGQQAGYHALAENATCPEAISYYNALGNSVSHSIEMIKGERK